jgi:hypothetical protein
MRQRAAVLATVVITAVVAAVYIGAAVTCFNDK